ncbi:4-hydroxy-tetrahydrodipicolinate reductase [Jeotgalibaca caeni]|uniref:4-hydroxy-tetrahydrodipicolinate reductase n=1 Tax=Jeotgalibaca caeni TaxID=3028623 RepID=UPI00237E5B88|nr:4-hydroxy-tetrahydrodipicolinate reductase [Jeotgalibaca caeni]MDE1549117.1 4-hydroxy-tetrahydrodipicolinate reductase [Jeotgalibaca caeni]
MKILLAGATGQMGTVVSQVVEGSEHTIVAGFAHETNPQAAYPIYQDVAAVMEEVDVIIDFSIPTTLPSLLAFALERKVGIVIASTGHSEENIEKIEAAAAQIPILFSGNLSMGVNVMELLAEKVAQALADFDIEIIEKHHRYKKDAPSGTAKMLFDAVNKGRGGTLREVDGRSGLSEGRVADEVGIASLRGGTIVGEHSVVFAGEDEVIEIKHVASSKKIFANGAVKAAEFLGTKENGLYQMGEVLGK